MSKLIGNLKQLTHGNLKYKIVFIFHFTILYHIARSLQYNFSKLKWAAPILKRSHNLLLQSDHSKFIHSTDFISKKHA